MQLQDLHKNIFDEDVEGLVIEIFDALSQDYYDGFQAQAVRKLLIEATAAGLFEKVSRIIRKCD